MVLDPGDEDFRCRASVPILCGREPAKEGAGRGALMTWMTREELCTTYGISQATLYRRAAKGEIKIEKGAGGTRYRVGETFSGEKVAMMPENPWRENPDRDAFLMEKPVPQKQPPRTTREMGAENHLESRRAPTGSGDFWLLAGATLATAGAAYATVRYAQGKPVLG